MKNTKGQLDFLRLIPFIVIFILFFIFGLAPFVDTVLDNSDLSVLGGMGALLIGSLNLWIILAFVILVFTALIFGFATQND